MAGRSSETQQPVAPLFSTPRDERQVRAVPVLRQMRRLVLSGRQTKVLEALHAAGDGLEREYARHELIRALAPITEIGLLQQWGDANLVLWAIDKALVACGATHRGGHLVSVGRQTRRAA